MLLIANLNEHISSHIPHFNKRNEGNSNCLLHVINLVHPNGVAIAGQEIIYALIYLPVLNSKDSRLENFITSTVAFFIPRLSVSSQLS